MSVGIDADTDTTALVGCILQAGFSFIFRYVNRMTAAEAQHITAMGGYVGSFYETNPTDYSYFSSEQGTHDAQRFLEFAQVVGQKPNEGSGIYFTVDTDTTAAEAAAAITDYFKAIRAVVYPLYKVGAYGDGATLQVLRDEGIVELFCLAGATGWAGSQAFDGADLIQSCGHTVCGIGVDVLHSPNGSAGGWQTS